MALEQPLQRCLIPCTRTIDEMKRRLQIGATQNVTYRRLPESTRSSDIGISPARFGTHLTRGRGTRS